MKKIICVFIVIGVLVLINIPLLVVGLFDSSNENVDLTTNLSKNVERYRLMVEDVATLEDMTDYVDLILCIIQQESGGNGLDIMQSSECSFNKRFPNIPNSITEPRYSVECGVKMLKLCFTEAGVSSNQDIETIKVALQGYNFGNGYIHWCKENYDGLWSYENALEFSDMMKVQLGWNGYGDPLYSDKVLNYYVDTKIDFGYDEDALKDSDFSLLIKEAEKYIGMPYVFGGSSPATSFDCSGFVCWVYTQSGVHSLPRTTAQGIFNQCYPISKDNARAGDLIFFQNTYNCPDKVTHIGIYVGNDTMLHCGDPIGYESINLDFWVQNFYGFGRLK